MRINKAYVLFLAAISIIGVLSVSVNAEETDIPSDEELDALLKEITSEDIPQEDEDLEAMYDQYLDENPGAEPESDGSISQGENIRHSGERNLTEEVPIDPQELLGRSSDQKVQEFPTGKSTPGMESIIAIISIMILAIARRMKN